MYLISACLCGVNCKYNGKNNFNEEFLNLLKNGKVIPVCPEQLGGLSTPRVPAEIIGTGIFTKDGVDVSQEFNRGSLEVLRLAREIKIKKAILKEGSPSCGCNYIYDGTFSGNKIVGDGCTSALLKSNGIEVISDEEYLKNLK